MSAHTPGPWRWEFNQESKRLYLNGGVPKYDLTVVDFVRYGMGGAAPRFREDVPRMNIMQRCENWAKPVPGREHHARWFQTIDHPDALLIAASPTLLDLLKTVLAPYDSSGNFGGEERGHNSASVVEAQKFVVQLERRVA